MPWPTGGPLGPTFRNPPLGWNPGGEDFLGNNLSCNLGVVAAGGTFNLIASVAGHPGIFECASGPVTVTLQTPDNVIHLGGGIWSFQSLVAVPILSTPTNRFNLRVCGVSNGPSTSITNNEVNFRYQDNVNGGRWEAVARSGGVETARDTGVAVVAGNFATGTDYSFETIVDGIGGIATYYIDGALVATISTDVPNVPVAILAMQPINIAGTGGSAYIDYFKPTFIENVFR